MRISRSFPFSSGGTGVFETREGFGAVWAKSLRNSLVACAVRILATISGLVFEGGGDGSTFFELGFIVFGVVPSSFVLEADFAIDCPSFLAVVLGFGEAAGGDGFFDSLEIAVTLPF
jgi:hypothetical protein